MTKTQDKFLIYDSRDHECPEGRVLVFSTRRNLELLARTIQGQARTNNLSEGWHTRFHLLMGKDHPDLFSFLEEIQKEQGDTEIAVVELSLGRAVKAAPKKKWHDANIVLQKIVDNYEKYDPIEYLGVIGDKLTVSLH